MEIIKYTKAELSNSFELGLKLKDIVLQMDHLAQLQNKVICRVRVNGLLLTESDEDRLSATSHQDIEEIEIELEDIQNLIQESKASLKSLAKELKEITLHGSELFRDGLTTESNRFFINFIPKVQCLTDALVVLKPNLSPEDQSVFLANGSWNSAEVHMMKTVQELIRAYECQDFVLVSDVLEYELYTSIDNWLSLMNQLS